MTPAELAQRLTEAYGLKRRLGFNEPRRIFDREFHLPTAEDARERVRKAMESLEGQGLVPADDYAASGADCENWALWITSYVTMQWAIEHQGEKSFPAYPIGQVVGQSNRGQHAWNCVVCQDRILTFDYGQEVNVTWKVNEGTFL